MWGTVSCRNVMMDKETKEARGSSTAAHGFYLALPSFFLRRTCGPGCSGMRVPLSFGERWQLTMDPWRDIQRDMPLQYLYTFALVCIQFSVVALKALIGWKAVATACDPPCESPIVPAGGHASDGPGDGFRAGLGRQGR
jgi:hypothetical protein